MKKRLKDDPNIKISKIIEEMMDTIVAKDLYNESGVGCDNMTCIVVVFKKSEIKETKESKETKDTSETKGKENSDKKE